MANITIKNKKTGVTKEVTSREWEVIQENPMIAKVWTTVSSKEAEVSAVPASKQKESKVISESK
ncbi:hypothetical protein [Sphingobacterium sp. LRF_L2]|uniref:hypothetical protein n=1 Tax=Sphingobacterium sp. LRF_L2 TaxID=3369421 RepID=UPI003F608CF0